ncbi:unnamed protein product [Caenorhabditis bovis]|uniref:Protoheme IX farnesyltransferase, mitochondrial n=1 Tax=Caenorhabditis bovis TaxID=2654633 RepID=A0A8S1F408_9PELO|nr:unnamed protein product [Caenorhabditis bovis]
MLSRQLFRCVRQGIAPSTSQAVFHTTPSNLVLHRAKPLDEEIHAETTADVKKIRRNAQVLDLAPKKRKKVDLVMTDTHLSQWYKMEPKNLAGDYLQLSKSKLSGFIAATACCGYLMAPVPVELLPLAACTTGTFLLSSAANACNQLLEAPYDAQMRRTQSRVLVVHRFSPLHAFTFAGITGLSGIAMLSVCNNPTAALLGALNWILYAGVYTPMKRTHIACTWAGAVVGAIPPLMGYAAATGTLDPAAWCLATILFSWQFPHFNGLSWNLRGDYSRAGYRVMCVTNERLCRITSIRHSLALVGLCSIAAPLTDLTTVSFALDSLPVNAYLVYLSYQFYKAPDAKNSRKLFFYSLIYLPLIMLLMGILLMNERDRAATIYYEAHANFGTPPKESGDYRVRSAANKQPVDFDEDRVYEVFKKDQTQVFSYQRREPQTRNVPIMQNMVRSANYHHSSSGVVQMPPMSTSSYDYSSSAMPPRSEWSEDFRPGRSDVGGPRKSSAQLVFVRGSHPMSTPSSVKDFGTIGGYSDERYGRNSAVRQHARDYELDPRLNVTYPQFHVAEWNERHQTSFPTPNRPPRFPVERNAYDDVSASNGVEKETAILNDDYDNVPNSIDGDIDRKLVELATRGTVANDDDDDDDDEAFELRLASESVECGEEARENIVAKIRRLGQPQHL